MHRKIIFASDIDNTLTDKRHLIPDEVALYLTELHEKNCEIIFLTGRTFSFAYRSLDKFSFPYHLAVQHGAEVLQMPEKKILMRNFLPIEIVFEVEMMAECIVYSGFETGDFCYCRRERYSKEMQDYFALLEEKASAPWVNVADWKEVKQKSIPLIKCFDSDPKRLNKVQKKLHQRVKINSAIIQDTVDPSLYILLITHSDACKGKSLEKLLTLKGWDYPIIAAGDDNNDIELLKRGTISIAMEKGPEALKKEADIIAKSSHENGIIEALEKAREMLDV